MKLSIAICVVAFLLCTGASSRADLPEGNSGLAAKHRGDRDLASDPSVLLAENFETGELGDLGKLWTDVSNKDGKVFAFSDDQPKASAGKRSLQMTSTLGENTGGHLFAPLREGVDTVFARFYVKFPADAQYVHHFVHLGGCRPSVRWPPGEAGVRPEGDKRFTMGIEPYGGHGKYPPPGAWNFYAYWPDMKISADKRYWGQSMPPVEPALVPRDRWQCVEVMLKCNAPEKSDGELALWLDGKLILHIKPGTPCGEWTGLGFQPLASGGTPFEGFRWRTHLDLKVNFFWLLFYVTENAGRQNRVTPNPVNRVWFDDIVVARDYVGPAVE